MNASKAAVLFVLFIFLVSTVAGVGLSPPQLRVENVGIGKNIKVAQVSVVNTADGEMYVAFGISSLKEERLGKLRVICINCSRSIGIQRADLKKGLCPFCFAGRENQTWYDLPPKDVLDNITLKCNNHLLEQVSNRNFITVDKVPANEAILVDVYVNIPDKISYYGQHWEARILATTMSDKEEEFINIGAESKLLIDTISLLIEEKEGTSHIFIVIGIIIAGIIIIICVLYMPKKEKVEVGAKHKKGRKIL